MAPECGASPDFSDFFSPDEFEVAQILLQLPLLIQKSNPKSVSYLGLLPLWGRKRKRSVSPSTPSPPLSKEEAKELSPTGPLALNSLALSPSESDENTKRSKKKASLNKKTEYLEAIDELTKRKQVLEGEIEAVKRHYNHLKTINSELKAKRQKMIPSFYNDSPQPEIGISPSSAMEIAQLTVKSSPPTLDNHQQQQQQQNHNHHLHYPQPSIKNRTAEPSQIPPPYDSSLGPIGIPDLNISLEEFAQRNYSKIKAAQARQRRIRICKTKNSNAAIKLQSPNPCR